MTYTVFNDTNKEIRFVDEKSCARLALITIIVTHQLRFSGEMWVGGCGGVKKVKPLCLAPQQNIRHAPQAENILGPNGLRYSDLYEAWPVTACVECHLFPADASGEGDMVEVLKTMKWKRRRLWYIDGTKQAIICYYIYALTSICVVIFVLLWCMHIMSDQQEITWCT
jgi:hypothetical protein